MLSDQILSAFMNKLAVKIRQSFDTGAPPQFPDFGSNWKFSESFEETGYFKDKSWDELSVPDFENHTCCHSFFPDNVALYYFGANMYVECVAEQYWSMAMDRLLTDLAWRFTPKKKVFGRSSRFGFLWNQMDEPQRNLVVEYLERATADGPMIELEVIRDALSKITHASWPSGH